MDGSRLGLAGSRHGPACQLGSRPCLVSMDPAPAGIASLYAGRVRKSRVRSYVPQAWG